MQIKRRINLTEYATVWHYCNVWLRTRRLAVFFSKVLLFSYNFKFDISYFKIFKPNCCICVLLFEAHIPIFLYPFLHTTLSKTRPFEYLRLTSLGVIGALVKVCFHSFSNYDIHF